VSNAADGVVRLLQRALRPLNTRIGMVVGRLVVDAVNDAAKRQGLRVLVLADEVLDSVEHFQPGGLTHVALKGAEGVLLCVGGRRGHPVALGVANREARPTGLQPGETGLYSASAETTGLKILLDKDGNVVLTPTVKVTINLKLDVTGTVTTHASGSPVELSAHTHNTAMGPSGPPNPVPP
jgi:phage baseplate assembly protein V